MDHKWQWYPGVYREECSQQVEGGDPPHPLGPSEAISGVLRPVLAFSIQEREWPTDEEPVEGYKDD